MHTFKRLIKFLIEIAFPRPEGCLLCGVNAGETGRRIGQMCSRCEQRFTFHTDMCSLCGRQWTMEVAEFNHRSFVDGKQVCGDCRRRAVYDLILSRSAVVYDKPVKDLISRYKFRGDRMLAAVLASFLVYAYKKYFGSGGLAVPDLISYIPVHESRLEERTFNQAEELAALLGAAVGIPVLALLEKTKATDKQSRKARKDRLHALDHAFCFKSPKSGDITKDALLQQPQLCILLVDDVYTTGSTLHEAAHVLKHSLPHARVYGLTVAR